MYTDYFICILYIYFIHILYIYIHIVCRPCRRPFTSRWNSLTVTARAENVRSVLGEANSDQVVRSSDPVLSYICTRGFALCASLFCESPYLAYLPTKYEDPCRHAVAERDRSETVRSTYVWNPWRATSLFPSQPAGILRTAFRCKPALATFLNTINPFRVLIDASCHVRKRYVLITF